jgi:methionine synthase II (cobalamin-independent)
MTRLRRQRSFPPSPRNGEVRHNCDIGRGSSGVRFVEHPELIAQRIARYANLVGRDNVIAGSDCGFGIWVGQAAVDPDVVWAKLMAMAEGARLATKQFWGD